MNRGAQCAPIFLDPSDRQRFVETQRDIAFVPEGYLRKLAGPFGEEKGQEEKRESDGTGRDRRERRPQNAARFGFLPQRGSGRKIWQ